MEVHPIFKKYVTPTPMPVPPFGIISIPLMSAATRMSFAQNLFFSSSDGRDDGGHRLTLAVVLNAIIFSWHDERGVKAERTPMLHVNHFLRRKLLPAAECYSSKFSVSQIVAPNKCGAARDAYLRWHYIFTKHFFFPPISPCFLLIQVGKPRAWRRQLY